MVYRSRHHATLKRNFQIMPGAAWLKLLLQHVPDRGEHLVRYYGWYSNRSRGDRKRSCRTTDRSVVGFDINNNRIEELNSGLDKTLEVARTELSGSNHIKFTSNPNDLIDCRTYIITVPTPIDTHKQPDLSPLIRASEAVGKALTKGDVVIFESTVYPGATEEVCVPVLEQNSGLKFNIDFYCGYSPERINPGDRLHRLADIVKVTSGSTAEAADFVDDLYSTIISAGTHKAPSIKVAEAAKVIENTQRDLNIALINELSLIFNRLGIETADVLEAAGTKWNFLPFRPGLVGGHCIGVDPYYLTHKAIAVGYYPDVVLAGRRINDGMADYVANRMVREMIARDIPIKGSRVLVLGLTFKENCPDLRNTRVVDVVRMLEGYGIQVEVHDPWVQPEDAMREYSIELVDPKTNVYSGILLSVAHDNFCTLGSKGIRAFGATPHVLFDLKNIFSADESDLRL